MIAGGDFTIQSEGDGLKADNSDDATLGYIDISGGTFVIQAEQDGIQASSSVNITSGEFDITTADGAGEVKTSGGMDFQKGWDMILQTAVTVIQKTALAQRGSRQRRQFRFQMARLR